MNTPRQVTRPSDNAQLWTWYSDPFGTDAANANPAGAGSFGYNLRFPGQVFDGQVGLHLNGYRDFDPAVGRYIESDPIGLFGGVNTYAFVRSNPIRAWDRDGLQEEEDPKAEGPIENAYEDLAIQSQVYSLVQNIRQYNPEFEYAIVGPPGVRASQQDVEYLRQVLGNYRSQNSCRGTPSPALPSSPYHLRYGRYSSPTSIPD